MSKLSKRAITLFVIATMVLSMLSAFIAVPVMAGVYLDPDFVTGGPGDSTAGWATVPDLTYGEVVELDSVSTATDADYAIVRIDVNTDLTLGTIIADLPTFMYKLVVIDSADNFLALEMLFTDGALGSAEITIFPYVSAVPWDNTLTTWQAATGHSGATYAMAYGYEADGTTSLDQIATSTSLTTVIANIVALDAAYADWELTRVGVQLGWVPITDQTALIDSIEVDGVTYDLETITPTPEFTIDFVTPGDVVYDQVLEVYGSGVTGGSAVDFYWDFVTAANKLNATTGKGSGEFESTVKVPSAVYGDHYLWVKDVASGISVRSDAIPVRPKIKLSPTSGLKNDNVIIKGYGFSEDSDIDITLLTLSADGELTDDDTTDDLGYFEYTFKVADVGDGTYPVTAEDEDSHSVGANFTVGAAVTLDKTVGPAGTIVKVDGRGFTTGLTTMYYGDNVTLDGYLVSTKDGKNISISSSGTFTAYVVVPSVPEGEYKFTFTNVNGLTGKTTESDTFEVDGETSIKVTPSYGTPGTTLQVKGYNFTRVSGTDVELKLGEQTAEATIDSSGSFTASIVVPPLDFGESYPVTANDTRFCHAEDDVLVALMVLQMSKYSAPVGSEIMLMGSGLTENGYWNATFGDMKLIEDTLTSLDTTYFSADFWVPSVPSGTYTIGVYDVDRKITVNIDFTVTEQAALSVSRASIPNGYNLTIEGVNFVEEAGIDSEWWIYNSTDAWLIDDNVTQGAGPPVTPAPVTDKYGDILCWYVIPEFLELGSYCMNCTTVSSAPPGEDWVVNQTAEICFEIVPEEVVINVGAPSYARGQTITFVIKATLKKDPFYLGIKDLEGGEVFNSTWNDGHWATLGAWFYIPSNKQIDLSTGDVYSLPVDAMPGTWTYSIWDDDKEYKNGTFQVTELTEIEQLQQDIGGLVSGMEGIGTSVIDLATTIAGVSGAAAEAAGAAAAAAAAAGEAVTAAEAAMAAVEDMGEISQEALDAANDAKSAADAAKTAADSGLAAANDAKATAQTAADAANDAADAAEGAKTAASGLTTLVYGAIVASLIAALAAVVSLMQISRRIAG